MNYDPENPDVVTVMRAVIAERNSRRAWRAFMFASVVAAAASLVAIYGWCMYFAGGGQ